jgi:ElaB/YqjD/DUF883 family membrane-anchored ribosome-binding protein
MQDQGFEGAKSAPRESATLGRNLAGAARDAYDKTAELSGEAAERARAAASDVASEAKSHMKGMLDRQVGVAATMVGDVAHSFHTAADDLDRSVPLAADLVRGLADRVSGYADGMQTQSAEDVLRSTSDFTRRQPALVFGLAALAGFFVFRTIKNTPTSIQAPSIQPSQQSFSTDMSDLHGRRDATPSGLNTRRRDGL